MPIISVTLPSDNTSANVADYNTPITTILSTLNGGLDDDNIASLSGTKITANTLPQTALTDDAKNGWNTGMLPAVSSVTANGNRSYTLTTSDDNTALISPGMRLRTTRTVVAPTQCTSLNGTTQYYSKTSPAGMTFTDDFTVSAWVKLSSYAAGTVVSRLGAASGWRLAITSSGQVTALGYNASYTNFSGVTSYQSIPLNKWVHITAQLDMSAFTATTTTSYVMIDGVDVPSVVARGGTNPTTLVQSGDLNIGAYNNAAEFFPGKIAQVAIYNAKVTQATMRGYMSQGLAGTETSLISAYSFNNSIVDLNANANNLTAQGSAVATNADSPFGNGGVSSTLDYALVMAISASTVTVQVPEGCTIPTTGGVSAVSYATSGTPFGWVDDKDRWYVRSMMLVDTNNGASTADTYYNVAGFKIYKPTGLFNVIAQVTMQSEGASATRGVAAALDTAAATATIKDARVAPVMVASATTVRGSGTIEKVFPSTASDIYCNICSLSASGNPFYLLGASGSPSIIKILPAGL